jgi:Signal transduction histidine kinase
MNENKKVHSSIVFQLNLWHVTQVFSAFLALNIILFVLLTASLFYHAETELSQRAAQLSSNTEVTKVSPNGFKIPIMFKWIAPENTKNAFRQIVRPSSENHFWRKLSGTRYRLWMPIKNKNEYAVIDYKIGETSTEILKLFIILFIFQALFLIGSIGKGARAMRRALKPIADLTRTARTINTAQPIRPDTQLRDLKGTIDTINAKHLDTRIKISTEQKELKDLTSAINGMLDRINEAYRSQVRFVSDASHELRTPIAVIQGYANLLDRWGKNDKKALDESIAAIKSEAESMKELVEQLLFLARGDNDTMQLSLEDINLSELVSEIMRETVMIDSNHVFSSKTDLAVYTEGDSQLIKQAIRIFVDNSIKYTPYDGAISVSTTREGDMAKIIIQDEGIGIPAEDLPNVFDRFFRSDDSRARKTGGTGLGLAIAKWIIDRHKGSVELLSRKEVGTRITICLLAKKTELIEEKQ